MATNVSQQDETLHKVIEWCEQREVEGLRLANALLQKHDLAAYAVVKAQIDAYCPLFWSDYGDERTLMNMGVFEKLLNEGWKILRVDTMPPTELRDTAVTATNVYILEREANDD